MRTRLKEIRHSRDLTQAEMADLLSLHRSSYSLIESEKRGLSAALAARIAGVLGVSTDYLLCLSELPEGTPTLSREEENVLLQYRSTDPQRQRLIYSLVREFGSYEADDDFMLPAGAFSEEELPDSEEFPAAPDEYPLVLEQPAPVFAEAPAESAGSPHNSAVASAESAADSQP